MKSINLIFNAFVPKSHSAVYGNFLWSFINTFRYIKFVFKSELQRLDL